jgi:aspartate kinase
MSLVVLKFGGTSIRDKAGFELAIKHIERELKFNHKVVCVVSAMGREQDDYSTDSLKNLISNYVTKKEQDRLISVGETISSVVFTDFLIKKGIKAISLATKELGIITDNNYTNANILQFNNRYINKLLEDYNVIIAPGFQGMTKDGNTTTLGRGGSDTTAIYLGIQLNADYVKIVSDVDGIYSGDPRVIKNAYKYDQINYDQLVHITNNGSKVLHCKGAIFAKQHKANIMFCHIEDPERYTLVTESHDPLFNITSKHNYYQFSFEEDVHFNGIDYYLGSYYVGMYEVEHFEKFLTQNAIKYNKQSGFCKISILNDHQGKMESKCAYVDDAKLIDHLNIIHDYYLFRG